MEFGPFFNLDPSIFALIAKLQPSAVALRAIRLAFTARPNYSKLSSSFAMQLAGIGVGQGVLGSNAELTTWNPTSATLAGQAQLAAFCRNVTKLTLANGVLHCVGYVDSMTGQGFKDIDDYNFYGSQYIFFDRTSSGKILSNSIVAGLVFDSWEQFSKLRMSLHFQGSRPDGVRISVLGYLQVRVTSGEILEPNWYVLGEGDQSYSQADYPTWDTPAPVDFDLGNIPKF
jgi:hypothetical protein